MEKVLRKGDVQKFILHVFCSVTLIPYPLSTSQYTYSDIKQTSTHNISEHTILCTSHQPLISVQRDVIISFIIMIFFYSNQRNILKFYPATYCKLSKKLLPLEKEQILDSERRFFFMKYLNIKLYIGCLLGVKEYELR